MKTYVRRIRKGSALIRVFLCGRYQTNLEPNSFGSQINCLTSFRIISSAKGQDDPGGKWGSSLANVSGNKKGTNIGNGGTLGSSLYGLSRFIPPGTKCNKGFNFYSSWSFDSSGLHDSVITTLKEDQDGIDDEDRGRFLIGLAKRPSFLTDDRIRSQFDL